MQKFIYFNLLADVDKNLGVQKIILKWKQTQFVASTALSRLINLSRAGQRKWNRVCQHGPSAGPGDDSAYRPWDIVHSFTSLSIHAPIPPCPGIQFRLSHTSKGFNVVRRCIGRRGPGGDVDRGYRGVNADCRRP